MQIKQMIHKRMRMVAAVLTCVLLATVLISASALSATRHTEVERCTVVYYAPASAGRLCDKSPIAPEFHSSATPFCLHHPAKCRIHRIDIEIR